MLILRNIYHFIFVSSFPDREKLMTGIRRSDVTLEYFPHISNLLLI